MKLLMKSVLWNGLQLDDPYKYDLALSCFYLGMNVEATRATLKLPRDHDDVVFIRSTASFSGMDHTIDSIVKVE